MQTISHNIPPVWNHQSRVLVLGSFPSPKSRETAFFYGHPQNRFWRVLAAVWEEQVPVTQEEKIAFLLGHHIAVWDVVASCTIVGASDSTIRDARPNDLSPILRGAPIGAICTTGAKANLLYRRLIEPQTGIAALPLPSSSPANAAMSLSALIEAYRVLRELAEIK